MNDDLTPLFRLFASGTCASDRTEQAYTQLSLHTDLRQYLLDLPKSGKQRLITSLHLEHIPEGQVIFHKGDYSDKMYLILSGLVDMCEEHGPVIATLTGGKVIGERGLVKRTGRLLTALARTEVFMLSLGMEGFVDTLGTAVAMRLEEKLTFINTYVPKARLLAVSIKERLAYAFVPSYYKRGHRLLLQGEMSPYLYFVKSGECSATHHRIKIVTLTAGCWFGEESILLNRPNSYTILVNSESAWLYTLTKQETMKLFPEPILDQMRRQCTWKNDSRKAIERHMKVALPQKLFLTQSGRFSLASSQARRSLLRASDRSPLAAEKESQVHSLLKKKLFRHTPSLGHLKSNLYSLSAPQTPRGL